MVISDNVDLLLPGGAANQCIFYVKRRIETPCFPIDYESMKVNSDGELVLKASLLKNFGLEPGDEPEVEVNRNGILVKPRKENADSVMKWLREEHGDEMVTLTNEQIFHLLK